MLRSSSRQTATFLALALGLAGWGCGSSADAPPATDGAARPDAERGGAMKVAPVDGRVGDATAATSTGGLESLKVRRRATDPRVLRHGVGAGDSCADVDVMPVADNLPVVSAATMCLVNGHRADAGLPPLTHNALLDQSAASHSQDMVVGLYFAHQSQDGRDVVARVRVTGYIPRTGGWTVGENLAWGTGTLATPRGIVQAWMDSQGHRENILRSTFREAGLGIALGNPLAADGEGATYTMNFGSTTSPTQTLTSGAAAPRTSDVTRRAAARRAAKRRLRACRTRAAKARSRTVRKARAKRCTRAARRLARR